MLLMWVDILSVSPAHEQDSLPLDWDVYQHQCAGSIWNAQHGDTPQSPAQW